MHRALLCFRRPGAVCLDTARHATVGWRRSLARFFLIELKTPIFRSLCHGMPPVIILSRRLKKLSENRAAVARARQLVAGLLSLVYRPSAWQRASACYLRETVSQLLLPNRICKRQICPYPSRGAAGMGPWRSMPCLPAVAAIDLHSGVARSPGPRFSSSGSILRRPRS